MREIVEEGAGNAAGGAWLLEKVKVGRVLPGDGEQRHHVARYEDKDRIDPVIAAGEARKADT